MLDRRQVATERIEQLDELVARVDGKRFRAADVFNKSAEAIQAITPASTTLDWINEDRRTCLLANGEPSSMGTSGTERWTGTYTLGELESLKLTVVQESATDAENWQHTFFDSVLDCCGVAFLKERYRLATSAPVVVQPKTKSRLILPTAVIAAVCTLAAFIPVPFRLPVEGVIAPAIAREVFAPAAGTLTTLEVHDGQTVQQGDVLAIVDQPEIELQHDRLHGELLTAETELASARVDHTRPQNTGSSSIASTHTAVLQARVRSLQRQVELIDQIYASLTMKAAIDGQIVMRDAQADWAGKTVMQSQALMSVIQTSGGFLSYLDLPSDQFAYLATAQAKANDEPASSSASVSMRLRSAPEVEYTGHVVRIADSVFIDKHHESVVEVTARLDDIDESITRVGAAVIGHVELGKRPLGFVLFRPLIERIRSMGW